MAPPPSAPARSAALDYLTRMTGQALDAPVVFVSLVDGNHRLLTSTYGTTAPTAMLLSWPFTRKLAPSGHLLLVTDAGSDPTMAGVASTGDGGVAAFAGMRLLAPAGHPVGTISVIDRKPREWNRSEIDFLRGIASLILQKIDAGSIARAGEGKVLAFDQTGAQRPVMAPYSRESGAGS